jgi:hypothetical protein
LEILRLSLLGKRYLIACDKTLLQGSRNLHAFDSAWELIWKGLAVLQTCGKAELVDRTTLIPPMTIPRLIIVNAVFVGSIDKVDLQYALHSYDPGRIVEAVLHDSGAISVKDRYCFTFVVGIPLDHADSVIHFVDGL